MRCLVVRHAPAEDGSPDAARALTPRGWRRAERAARVLPALVPQIARIAASPLRRAQETAQPLARALRQDVETLDALTPGRWAELWPWLAAAPACVCVVGHAPDLDELVCAALGARGRSFVALGKGGAALLEFPGAVRAGHAELRWLLTPRLLRRLRPR